LSEVQSSRIFKYIGSELVHLFLEIADVFVTQM